jgi:CHASE2 domain-containing sensor protein
MAAKKASTERRSKPGIWGERLSEYKQELIKLAIIGIPVAALETINGRISDRILDQPWQAIVFLIPIAAVAGFFAWRVSRAESLRIDRRTLMLLGAYLLFFSVAANTHVLDWTRQPSLFGRPSERGWLTPVSWGDWRYRLVPKVDGDEVAIVMREPTAGTTRERARAEIVTLMGLAATQGARGIAFDYYFDGESAIDQLLCSTVETIGIPVVFGYGFEYFQGHMNALAVPRSLRPCVTPERQGHLVGFLDADHKARIMPLFFNHDRAQPALSLRIARALRGEAAVSTPDDGLLPFVEPAQPHIRIRLADLLDSARAHDADRNALRGRFVLVAEASESDSFDTPFGRTSGAIVHANAIHSLTHGHYIRQGPEWIRLVSLLAFCYGLAVCCASGVPAIRLVWVCIAATVCFWATAVVGILTGPHWFDAIYPTAAVWLLLPLLLMLRRVTGRHSTRAAAHAVLQH